MRDTQTTRKTHYFNQRKIRVYEVFVLALFMVAFLTLLFGNIYSTGETRPTSGSWNDILTSSRMLFFYDTIQIFPYGALLVSVLCLVGSAFNVWDIRRSSLAFIAAYLFPLAGIIYLEHAAAVSSHQLLQKEMIAHDAFIMHCLEQAKTITTQLPNECLPYLAKKS